MIETLEHFLTRVIGTRGTLGCRLVEEDLILDEVSRRSGQDGDL